MKKVIIYVEGIFDKLVLEMLFNDLITHKTSVGVFISIHEAPKGDKKKSVLLKVPIKAADILAQNSHDVVVAIPDLYPLNKGFPHTSFSELESGIRKAFIKRLETKNVKNINTLNNRFKVFCFKYDMEVLLLAAENELINYLKASRFRKTWTKPVEDQNGNEPPKRIVEKLFLEHQQTYNDRIDATGVLDGVQPELLASECLECFDPFVKFLKSI